MIRLYLQRYGDAVVDPIRAVVANFRMPLADTIRGYWRWALKIADTARYDHTEAYDHLLKVVDRAVNARSDKVAARNRRQLPSGRPPQDRPDDHDHAVQMTTTEPSK